MCHAPRLGAIFVLFNHLMRVRVVEKKRAGTKTGPTGSESGFWIRTGHRGRD